tara:strand:- start:645 stop:911 length:267 start_codon:yes stop_codon:yes gene_type:complete
MGFKKNNRRNSPQPAVETKPEARLDRKETKVELKADKNESKRLLIEAKAKRLKWLVILIGIGLVAYFALSSGGLGKLGSILKTFNIGK